MIKLDTHEDGFSIIVNGRSLLKHSIRNPLIAIGRSETVAKRKTHFLPPKEQHKLIIKAREWKLVSSKEDFLDIEFNGLLRMYLKEYRGTLHITFSQYDSTFNLFTLKLSSTKDEAIFGCAYSSSKINLKGQKISLWNGSNHTEKRSFGFHSSSRPKNSLFRCKPAFITTARRYVQFNTDAYCIFDFRKAKTMNLCSWAIPEEIILGYELDAMATIRELSFLSGINPKLPDWTWKGAWLGVNGGIHSIKEKLSIIEKSGARIGALCIEDCCGQKDFGKTKQRLWNWSIDNSLYPNLAEEIAKFKRQNIRVFAYINPCLDVEGDLYLKASKLGFCVKTTEGNDYIIQKEYFNYAIIDIYNSDAFSWLKSIIKKEFIDSGFSGWIADLGDILPAGAMVNGDIEASQLHNSYSDQWATLNAEAIKEAGKEEELAYFMNSAWLKAAALSNSFFSKPRYANWHKDSGFPGIIPAALSLGFSGEGSWHPAMADSFFKLKKSQYNEYLMRWTEFAVFSPILRTSDSLHKKKKFPLWTDQKLAEHFGRMSVIWSDLAPYHAETMESCLKDGLPPIRHCWLHYEDETWLLEHCYQYLYGRDILVAPVLKPGKILANAFLPQDEWVHLWTSRHFYGGELTIEAPLGYPPIFYRAKSKWAGLFEGLRRSARQKAGL